MKLDLLQAKSLKKGAANKNVELTKEHLENIIYYNPNNGLKDSKKSSDSTFNAELVSLVTI